MITIAGKQIEDILFPERSMRAQLFKTMKDSTKTFDYNSLEELKFELNLRSAIVEAAKGLNRSALSFAIFPESKCNEDYWQRTREGGFLLKNGVSASEAILDIYTHGEKYATECATAMVIVYYRALLDIYGEKRFDELFPEIELMNWHHIDRRLLEIGLMRKEVLYLPGDRRYFSNPDVDPLTPEWQGENVIDLDGQLYYGHGVGIRNAETLIKILNECRTEDADESAFLMDSAGRPDFKRLFTLASV